MKSRPANPSAMENQFDELTKAFANNPTRRKTLQLLGGGFLATLFGPSLSKSWAMNATTSTAHTPGGSESYIAANPNLSICSGQDYALCAGVVCYVFNNVAYCRCNLKHGNSVSRTLSYPGGDVCTLNAAGPSNGYVISTFSVPSSSNTPSGDRALYFCPPSPKSGDYASCDGGICFASSRGRSYPGLGQLGEDEIVCACTIASGSADAAGHQIFGPYPCEASFYENCKNTVATGANGTLLYEAAPTGSYAAGALVLDGEPANFNICSH